MNFKTLLRDLILEDARLEKLIDMHATDKVKVNKETGKKKVKKASLNKEQMMMIVGNDPTSRIDGLDLTQPQEEDTLKNVNPENVKKTGEYTQWIIKQYKQLPQTVDVPYGEPGFDEAYSEAQRLFFEDLFKIKEDLTKFHRFKKTDKIQDADINKYSIKQLEDAVADLSLELATTTKSERKSSLLHPGAEFMFETPKWFVVTMTRNDELGKEAAIYYGGNQQRTSKGETSWCTSAPGYNYYFNYLKQGPYYVLIDKTDENKGQVSGLPAHRYQFHFESNQFMNADDRQIDFVKFFNENPDLKEGFKTIITKHFGGKGGKNNGNSVSVSYPSDGISKLIGLYGFEDFFNNLNDDIQEFEFAYEPNRGYRSDSVDPPALKIPESLGRFKSMTQMFLKNCVVELPNSISELKNLTILGLPENKDLKSLPVDSFVDLIKNGSLEILLLKGTGISKLDPKIQQAIDEKNQGDSPILVILD